jgi:hypothetical protein
MLSRYMEVSPLQQEQPSSEERMQQKNISSQPSLLGRQHKSHSILPCCLWPVIEFLARPVLFSRQEREPTQHAAWKQTTSTFQETTSLHQLQKRKEQVMPPPWLPQSLPSFAASGGATSSPLQAPPAVRKLLLRTHLLPKTVQRLLLWAQLLRHHTPASYHKTCRIRSLGRLVLYPSPAQTTTDQGRERFSST